jgi:hypothetical protein
MEAIPIVVASANSQNAMKPESRVAKPPRIANPILSPSLWNTYKPYEIFPKYTSTGERRRAVEFPIHHRKIAAAPTAMRGYPSIVPSDE